ncbi:MAG TPA: M20/M25/M40 family metallo-hydrolase [Thermomicrobiaceae bacterium]|nr:M20/M25/M40 family metallo-hydrolase [Thermomicrobiaceae bacterium]
MAELDDVYRYIDDHREEYIALVQRLCRQPSISAQNVGIQETAALVKQVLEDAGASARIVPVAGGNPVVYAEAGPEGKTLSFYNHYDVQPPEPLDLWDVDPFAAEIRDGRIYARGVADNKGNIASRVAAIDAYRTVRGELPLRVKFIIEGEEEIGSPHLERFTAEHPDLVRADGNIWESGSKDVEGRPIISLGLKGICYVELRVRSTARDLHSSLGASVPNAAWRLTWALASLKGPDERVRIPGFYDKVVPPTADDLKVLESLPDTEAKRRELYQIDQFVTGLSGRELKLKEYFQPTCTICGLESGYTGPGAKTVMPAQAMAKVDFRLVIDQDPEEIRALLRTYLDDQGFSDIEVVPFSMEHPARTSPDAEIAQVAIAAHRELDDKEPIVVPTSLGTGPAYVLAYQFGIPFASSGVGHADSRAHSPMENIYVEDYLLGIKRAARIIDGFAPTR